MRRVMLIGVVFGLMGCSDRASERDTSPVWPDLILDQPVLDVTVDGTPDLGPPDGPALDRPDGDLPVTPWTVAQAAGGADLHDVTCLPGGQVFVAGNLGTMLYHAPGSSAGSFTKQVVGDAASPVTSDLYTVTFADTSYGATAGKNWQIWETNDLGQTWSVALQCSAYVFDTFYSLDLAAANAGFGAGIAVNNQGGGYKYYAGYSWVCGETPHSGEVFYDVFRLGAYGWIVGDTGGTIYRTDSQNPPTPPAPPYTLGAYASGTTEILRAVTFDSSGAPGVAVGDKGTIVVSTDGEGKVWSKVASPTTADLYGVTMLDALVGWAVGKGGALLRTGDGGQSWTAVASGVSADLESICFTSATDGWAVGQGGTVIYTTSGGF